MAGDAEAIDRLYREMIGEEVEQDLSGVWAVCLGAATEELNLDWFARKQGQPVTRRGEVINHAFLPWAACTIDGWSDQHQCPIECKHVGGREPIETVIARYQPQCQWQMEVTGADQCALSIIAGANEPLIEWIERDPDYAAEMVRRGAQFMRCVQERRPPIALAPAAPPIEPDKTYDMAENQKWRMHASSWLQAHGAAEIAKRTERELKALVPDDAKLAYGAGVRVTRDRAGRMSLRKDE
jgi:hypothetical protein